MQNFIMTADDDAPDASKDWNKALSLIQKLMLVNSLAPHKSIMAIVAFIQNTLGKRFTDVAGNSTLPAL